jgi:hypothetical protein
VCFHKSGERFEVSICAGPSESSGEANFHEKALFVKPTWRLLAVERFGSVSFAMLPFAVNTL